MSDHITLVGNIVGDLEQRSTRGGGTVAAFRLAVGERRFDRERGEWVDGHTNYYAISVFGELGAHALRSFRKGERVLLTGRLRLREWETETKRGVSADVVADAIGHDLRWGVSQFARTPKAPAAEVTGADAASTSSTTGDGRPEEWAVPGASLVPAGEGAADATATAVPVGAPVGGGSGNPDDGARAEETPF